MLESFRCLPVPALQSRPAQVLRDYPVKWFRKLHLHFCFRLFSDLRKTRLLVFFFFPIIIDLEKLFV